MADRAAGAMPYAGFISYSHSGDAELGRRLHREVERFAKPWHRLRAVRLFRDDTNLSASPGLWTSIETALNGSEWLVLLVSPEAAGSVWVGREVAWWLEHRGTDRILLVLTAGDLVWDEAGDGFDPDRSTALPAALRGRFAEEPLWVDARWARTAESYENDDPRLQRTVVDVSAALRGMDKDAVVGEAAREHRRTRRIVRAAWTALVSLLVLALVAAGFAWVQRGRALDQEAEARQQARVARSGQLAALSGRLLDSDLRMAAYLAVAAYDQDVDPQSRAAVLQAATTSPRLVGSVETGGSVAVLGGDGADDVLLGLDDGQVERWRVGDAAPTPVVGLDAAPVAVAEDEAGDQVLATDGTVLRTPSGDVTLPTGARLRSVAVDLAGGVGWAVLVIDGGAQLWRVDLTTLSAAATALLPSTFQDVAQVYARPGGTLTLLAPGVGDWAVLAADGSTVLNSGSGLFGAHEAYPFASPDGTRLGVGNGDGPLVHLFDPLTASSRAGFEDPAVPPTVPQPVGYATDDEGLRVAVADRVGIELDPTHRGSRRGLTSERLRGGGSVDSEGLRFLRDGRHLVSVGGSRLVVWDLAQADRSAEPPVTVTGLSSCGGCAPFSVRLSAAGDRLLVEDDDGTVVVSAPDGSGATTYGGPDVGLAVWLADGRLVVPYVPVDGVGHDPPILPAGALSWPLDSDDDAAPMASGATAAGDVASVLRTGEVVVQDAETGATRGRYAAPAGTAFGAAVDQGGRWAATLAGVAPDGDITPRQGRVTVTSLDDGSAHATLPREDYEAVAFGGDRLLAQRSDGTLEVWADGGTRLERTVAGDPSYFSPPAGSADGSRAARVHDDGTVTVVDLDTGLTLGTVGSSSGVAGLTTAALGADADTLVTVVAPFTDAVVTLRHLDEPSLVGDDCRVAIPPVTAPEWARSVGDLPFDAGLCRDPE